MSKTRANMLLLLAAAIWGFGNIAHKTILDELDALTAVALASLIGAVLVAPFAALETRRLRRAGCISLVRLSVLFTIGIVLQQIAFVTASVTNASFLISSYTVITPLLAWIMMRERPAGSVLFASSLALLGSMLLSGGLPGLIVEGDLFAILAAFMFSVWMIETGRHARRFDCPATTACGQFLTAAILILPFCVWNGSLEWQPIAASWRELVFLGVFSTAVGYLLQIRAQRYTSASHAAIIASSECAFAAGAAAIILDERLSTGGLAGAIAISSAVLMVAAAGKRESSAAVASIKPLSTAP